MRLNGISNSFTNLVKAFQTPVYNLCSLLLGNGPAAERAAQECFTQAYLQFHDPTLPQNTQNWLLRIAYKHCLSWLALSVGQTDRAGAGDAQIAACKSTDIRALLDRLEPEDRAAVALRHSYQLELLDIAWIMEADDETVKNRLRKAKKTLAAKYCQENQRLPEY